MENNYNACDASNPYKDIINLPHHTSSTHMRMPAANRGAQFSPFAALTGYDAAIRETARLTEGRLELDEDEKANINSGLNVIKNNISKQPFVKITYFKPDDKKEGGAYVTAEGSVKKLDEYERVIVMTDKTRIIIDEIVKIEGDIISEGEAWEE